MLIHSFHFPLHLLRPVAHSAATPTGICRIHCHLPLLLPLLLRFHLRSRLKGKRKDQTKWLKSKPATTKTTTTTTSATTTAAQPSRATCHYFMPLQRNSIAFFAFNKVCVRAASACVCKPVCVCLLVCECVVGRGSCVCAYVASISTACGFIKILRFYCCFLSAFFVSSLHPIRLLCCLA